ncbi:MAG: DUF885 domain-containing protein, partial [Planctomycetota bacterium]|nr:DUF885 domain-containing protein [Planctomycetota bacterium]
FPCSLRAGDLSMKRIITPLILVVSAVLGSPALRGQDKAANTVLHTLLEKSWEFDVAEDPLFATRLGRRENNHKLASNTIDDIRRRAARRAAFLSEAEAIDLKSLSPADQLNLQVFIQLLRDGARESSFPSHLIPISNRWGFHIAFPELPKRVPLKTLKDHENYIARLLDFKRYGTEQITLLRLGIKARWVLPAVVLEGYGDTITTHIVTDPTQSLLYGPFLDLPASIKKSDQDRLRRDAQAAIADSVVPTYQAFDVFMRNEYLPAARGSVGASALPDGRAFYRHRVRQFTTLDVAPENIHQVGLNEVRRIRREMKAIPPRVQFKGDLSQFITFLRTDKQFYPTTPEQLEKEVSLTLKKMDGQLPTLFKKLPRMPYGIRRVPAYIAPKTTTAYYSQPAGDGTRAGFYYINTYNLSSRPLFEIEALSLHEAVPGHHLQLALQQELVDLPDFRRFAGFTAFVEGWALYAERLGLEVGFYKDPYSDFGRLSYEMWRACRLVVDTGIHYMGWSRERAIDYMKNQTALSLHNIEAEIDRYIAWPGQALAYKIGELKIRELRTLAENELADKFDVRDFHDVVLRNGSLPLPLLETNVRDYIKTRLTQP